MTEPTSSTTWQAVASPFCGIASDDLEIQVEGTQVRITANADAITQSGFETPITDTQPRIHGQPASLAEAVTYIEKQLKESKNPLFGGLGTDLNGARSVMAVADKIGATVDSQFSYSTFRNTFVLQDTGYMTTTLTEVRNRVDLLIVVGGDIEVAYPRFFERIIWPEASMFEQNIADREIVYLGTGPSGDASTSPSGRKAQVLPCEQADLPEVISVLRALLKGKPIQAQSVGGIAITDLKSLADKVKQAKYSVFTWAAMLLDFEHAEATVQMLCEAIKEINFTTRSNGLPLGGKEGDTTVNHVSAWQSGYPMRTSFNRGFPDYDPFVNAANRMLQNEEVDLLIWVNSFNVKGLPPKTTAETIVLGRSGMQFDVEPAVFIPVGVPGIDHAGRTFRCDSVVSVPLRKLRDSGLPSVFDVLSAVENAL